MTCWLKGTEVKKSLAGDSMFIWVGVRLYLPLAVTVMSEVRGTMGGAAGGTEDRGPLRGRG